MIRLLRRIADTQLRAENERLRRENEQLRCWRDQAQRGRQTQAELTARWRSIAYDRGRQLDEMKEQKP